MADSGGHWKTLAEARKLTQSTKIPGVFETDPKMNNPIERVPVAQAAATGTSIKWLRNKTDLEDSVNAIAIGGQLSWTEDVEYDEIETELKILAIQRKLDKFVRDIYSTYNNYRAIVYMEMQMAMMKKMGDRFIYGDVDASALQADGIHAWTRNYNSTDYPDLNIDEGEGALSLANLRRLLDAMPLGVDEIWVPKVLGRRFDQMVQEAGIASYVGPWNIQYGINELGKRVVLFDGIPIIRTDYLVAEQINTGIDSTSVREKVTAGATKYYSIFAVKFGNLMEQNPGICLAYGGTEGQGDLFEVTPFEKLEDYIGEGLRLASFQATLLSQQICLGRIVDITDADITA